MRAVEFDRRPAPSAFSYTPSMVVLFVERTLATERGTVNGALCRAALPRRDRMQSPFAGDIRRLETGTPRLPCAPVAARETEAGKSLASRLVTSADVL